MNKEVNILAIIGSPRKGNTYKICQSFEDKVTKIDPTISIEYLFLKDKNIKICRGCHVCLLKGGEFCPLKDDIPEIINLLKEVDGFIVTSPGYSQHVPAIMKNFIDRLTYICHTPLFHEKIAVTLATVAGMGLKPTLKYISLITSCWGTQVIGSLGVMMDYLDNVPKYRTKTEKELETLARKFCRQLRSEKKPVPTLNDMIVFVSLREETRFSPLFYKYWKDMGWTKMDYYYKVRINPLKLLFARLMGYFIKKEMEKVLQVKS